MEWYKLFDTLAIAEKVVPIRSTRLILAGNRKICLARTRDGFFAVDDVCPHLGESLSRGTVNYLDEIICPWHSFRYHLKHGQECEHRTKKAKTYPIRIDTEGLFIGIPES